MRSAAWYRKEAAKAKKQQIAVREEFARLQKAFNAYDNAMSDRIKSADVKGEEVNGHTLDIGNSHQSQIDRFREATKRFSKNVVGDLTEEALAASMDAYNEVMDRGENEALV